jgi:predicted RNase H-like HicB family nuclease
MIGAGMVSVSNSVTDVRQGLAEFLDNARIRPQYIKRRNYEYIVLPTEMLETLMKSDIKVRIMPDDDKTFYTENEMFSDIIGFGKTREEALRLFKNELVEYAYEYYEGYPMYSAAPNRAHQMAPVLKLIARYERYGDIDSLVEVV